MTFCPIFFLYFKIRYNCTKIEIHEARRWKGVTCSVPDEFLILLSMVFCLKNCHMWKNKEIFMWPSWCLTCALMLTIFQVTGGSSNHPRLVPKWLREILIFWVTRYSLSNMLKNDTLMRRYRIFEFYRWSSWWMVGCLIYLGSDKICSLPGMLAYLYQDVKEWSQSWYLFFPGVVLAMCIKKW